jgi:myo-inositol-1(or 4)-monophosphatase
VSAPGTTEGRRDELVARLGDLATDLATGAAALVAAHAQRRHQVHAKSTVTDLVTDVDRLAEDWLRERIATLRPADAVLGEERGASRHGNDTVRWVLDPIDGTVNFVLGLPHYAVSVAAELRGEVVAGAVCNPATGELFHARLGAGAYADGTPITGPRDVPPERMVVGTGFGYQAQTRTWQADAVARLLPRVADIRRMGAASLDLCAVAAGRLDAYFESGLSRWDYAAGVLIAAEAGCVVFGPGGGVPSPALVGAAGREHAASFAALLAEVGALPPEA